MGDLARDPQNENAVATVIKEGNVGMYDVKGRNNNPNSTTEVAEEGARNTSSRA